MGMDEEMELGIRKMRIMNSFTLLSEAFLKQLGEAKSVAEIDSWMEFFQVEFFKTRPKRIPLTGEIIAEMTGFSIESGPAEQLIEKLKERGYLEC